MFERTLKIIDEKTFNAIKNTRILLIGVGGVGSSALEALVRTGFQDITIVDHDLIDKTNLNRQIITNIDNIGNLKVEEAKKRCENINNEVDIKTIPVFLNENNINEVLNNKYDYIIDACDTITTKFLLIKKAFELDIKIISCMGTGNRLDPEKLTITTLNKTNGDPLAKAMRSILKKHNISLKVPVIWSSELPIKTGSKDIGSLIIVPMTAGMLINKYLINDIKKTTI